MLVLAGGHASTCPEKAHTHLYSKAYSKNIEKKTPEF
jgi:hypothetical protein